MEKNKYSVIIEWSEEDQAYLAKALEFPSLIAHGKTEEEACRELKVVLSEAIKWMLEEGEPLPKPLGEKEYKGNISLRIPPETHRTIALLAAKNNLSINQFLTTLIEKNMYTNSIESVVEALELQAKRLAEGTAAMKTVIK